jgi:hypothetical protein
MIDINKILEEAPSKVAYYAENENLAYAKMIQLHQDYKELRAVKYKTKRNQEATAQKDIEYGLDCDEDLIKIKRAEIEAEVKYREWRTKKDKARDYFEMAREMGWNQRTELRNLGDTISE